MQCAEGGRADLRFARAAFRDDERRFLAVKLPLDGLCHRELGVIEGITGPLRDKVVDGQHFIRERFAGRIKERHELIADAVRDGHTKGIEVPCDIVDIGKAVRRTGNRAGDLNKPCLQPFLQHLNDIPILYCQLQHPCVDPLLLRDDLQLPEVSSALERSEHIVPKRGNERRCRFVIQLLEKTCSVSLGAENIALSRLLRSFKRSFLAVVLLTALLLCVVAGHERCHGIHTVVSQLPPIPFQRALQQPHRIVLGGFYGRAAVDGVRHSPNHLGVSTEADRTDHASFFVVIEHNRISVGG